MSTSILKSNPVSQPIIMNTQSKRRPGAARLTEGNPKIIYKGYQLQALAVLSQPLLLRHMATKRTRPELSLSKGCPFRRLATGARANTSPTPPPRLHTPFLPLQPSSNCLAGTRRSRSSPCLPKSIHPRKTPMLYLLLHAYLPVPYPPLRSQSLLQGWAKTLMPICTDDIPRLQDHVFSAHHRYLLRTRHSPSPPLHLPLTQVARCSAMIQPIRTILRILRQSLLHRKGLVSATDPRPWVLLAANQRI